jgi:hypothetical protein
MHARVLESDVLDVPLHADRIERKVSCKRLLGTILLFAALVRLES